MRLFSTRPAPRIGARLLVAMAVAVTTAGTAGCRKIETEETAAEFVRSSSAPPCTDDPGPNWRQQQQPTTSARMMDSYVVQVLEIDDVNNIAQDGSDCTNCVATGANCHVEAQDCYCGGPTAVSPTELGALMSGARVGELDYGHLYCLRVLAVDRSSVTPAPPQECSCDPSWTTPAFLGNSARLCALSAPYSAGPLAVRLSVQCRSDQQSFAACVGTTAPSGSGP